MKIECQYYGDYTKEVYNNVIGLSLIDHNTLLIVFDNEETITINRPDYIKEVK